MKSKYTEKEKKILDLITNFYQNECGQAHCCPEEECVLWNIEQVIVDPSEEED